MHWNVVAAKPGSANTISVTFQDGTCGIVRFEPSHLTGVFSALHDPELFRQVRVDEGTVSWPGDIDLAPDAMYAAIKASGEWVLR